MHGFASNARQWTTRKERCFRAWFSERPLRSTLATFGALFASLVLIWALVTGYSAYTVRVKTNDLTRFAENPGETEISSQRARDVEKDLVSLKGHVDRLERLTRVPLIEGQVAGIPALGPRYAAGRDALRLAQVLGEAGVTGARIGHDAYAAFEETGISYDDSHSNDSWLFAVDRHRGEMPALAEQIREAREIRESIDTDLLPSFVRTRFERLDPFLRQSEEMAQLAESYDEFFRAAGGEGTVRYLFLFQNPAELRPAGGFPGTFGVFEFHSGQLVGYEMWDSHLVTMDYMQNRSEKIPQPWPFETYAPQDGLLLHDATWYADFPYTAELMLEMYAETTWPGVNGVVAVQPEAVSDMVRATGPVEVEVDGEIREVTEENVYDEVERYRRLRFEGLREGELGDHKDILIDIGEAIMEKFQESEGADTVQAVRLLMDSADRRDLQIYIQEPGVQAFLDGRGWSGKLEPDPDTPTIALTFTNFVLEKASMAMQPYYDLHLRPDDDGGYHAVFHIALQHTGRHDQDHRYFGFQRWWIEAHLPDGSNLIDSSHEVMPDPEAPNGGAYALDLFPEQLDHLTLEFELPELDRFMIRRQPGQVPPKVRIHMQGCEPAWGGYLVKDIYVDLRSGCPAVPDAIDDPPPLLMLSKHPVIGTKPS